MPNDFDDREIVGDGKIFIAGKDTGQLVPVRVVIPRKLSKLPKATLIPSAEQFKGLVYVSSGVLSLLLENEDEDQRLDLRIDALWIEQGTQKRTPSGVDSWIDATPRGISIVDRYKRTIIQEPLKPPVLRMWVSQNKNLFPAVLFGTDSQGISYVDQVVYEISAVLPQGSRIVFVGDKLWRVGASSKERNLFASCELDACFVDLDKTVAALLSDLNVYLLVVSLATRTRTTAFGWDLVSGGETRAQYLAGTSIPTGYSVGNGDDLVDRSDHAEFFQHGFDRMVLSAFRESLQSAVYALTPQMASVLEHDFLSLFSAIEEILLQYRRQAGLEFVLPLAEWSGVKSAIKRSIKGSVSDKETRRRLYQKLDEINRISIAEGFSKFASDLDVDLADTWPLFDTTDGASLYELRNWLAHGEPIPREIEGHLWVAQKHLRWTLERIVLKLLDWPLERSEISPSFLRSHATAMHRLKKARSGISEVMKGVPNEKNERKGDGGN